MHLILAFSCFFRLLFGRKLPPEVVPFLSEAARAKLLPPPKATPPPKDNKQSGKQKPKPEPAKPQPKPEPKLEPVKVEPVKVEPPKPKDLAVPHRDGALALLALLQREGRLVDFLREDLGSFDDADIGAAARDVHRGCRKVLEDHLTLEPVMPGAEDDKVTVPKGFNPGEIRLVGEAKGEPPFKGTLRHHGWRAVNARLPVLTDGVDRAVLAPAEVEV